MAKTKSQVGDVMTPECRIAWPNVFTPRAATPGAEPKYSMTMIFPKTTDITVLKQNVASVLVEQFGPNKTKWPKFGVGPGLVRLPFRDGAEKEGREGFGSGVVFISASSKFKPGVVDQAVQPIITESEFYGGCYVRAKIRAFWYDSAGNRGVSFNLGNVQKIKDGEPLGGGSSPADDFDAIPVPSAGGVKVEAGAKEDDDPLGV